MRGFEKGLELFYTPPHWNMVYPVERVRAEGTFGIGRVEDVTGEYEGRNLPDGHRVHRYHFSVHDGSLKKATRLDLELSAEGGIVDVHHDRWEVDGVALDPSLMRSEAADSKIIARLAEKFSADEFLAATPLPEGQVRLFLLHRAKSLKEAVGNTHYLAIDLKPDPETGNFLGQNVEVTRATFRHEPKDPVKFLAPSRLLNNFSYMRRTGNGAVRHSHGFMMVEPFESSSKLTFLFYDDTAQSRRKVEITLQKNGDASLGVMEPGSLSLTNYNDGTEIIHRADARLAATAEGDLIKYELHHPQMELHFYLTADGNFPADLNGHAFVIREFSTPQALVAARTRREEERTKRESVKAIQDVYKAFVSKNRSDWSEETRALVDGFAAHSLSNSGLGLAVKYLLPIYAENSEYPDEEVPDLIDRLLPRAMVFQDIVDGKLGGEEAFARLFPSVAARIQRNREAFEEAQALKEGRKTGGKGEKKKKGQEEDPEESREGSALFIPPDERTEKSIPAHAPRVLAEYLVALSLASTIPWMKREWEKLALALDNLLEDKILGDPSRVSAYGGFAHLLHQSRDLAIEPAVRLLVSPRVAWGRERDFYEYLTTQDRRRIGRQAIKEWFDNFGLADPLAEVPKKKERPVREVEDEPAQVANPAPARGPSGEKGVNYLGRPQTFSAEQAGSSRVPAKSGGGADPKPGGPGSAKASAAGLGEMMLPEGLNIYSGADTRQTDADRTMAETGHVEYMDDGGVAIAAEGEGEEGADDIEPVGFSSFGHGSAIFGVASFTQLRAANNTMHYLVRR
ncbi:MAG: hypothetical protein HY541_01400 [Deltaproteobacteria bacterium]|nr:hypothetical protein [Deltaproteobacteria bacterium]